MDEFSLPRRIWRIAYPILIFLGIQLVIGLAVGVCLAIAFTIQEAISGAAALDAAAVMEGVTRFLTENAILIMLIANLVAFTVFFPMWLKTRKRIEPYKNKTTIAIGILVFGFFFCFNVVQIWIFGLVDITRFFPAYNEIEEVFSSGSLAIQIVTVGIAAPVVEELLFRGVLINRMRWLPVWASVFIQALLFGVVHLNWFQSIYAFIDGILLGLIYIKYRSVIMTITGHMAFNLASVLLGEFLTEQTAPYILLGCPGIVLACGVMLAVIPRARKTSPVNNDTELRQSSERAGPYIT